MIPGSGLKGLIAAWTTSAGIDEDDLVRVLGSPRPSAPDATPGRVSVCFLDALPDSEPLTVQADVLTPRVKRYYDSIATAVPVPVPPPEYHNPVPLQFLTVRGAYAVDLCGRDEADLALLRTGLHRHGGTSGQLGADVAAPHAYRPRGCQKDLRLPSPLRGVLRHRRSDHPRLRRNHRDQPHCLTF